MNHTNKVCFYTLGCKLNFSETSTIARSFEEAGYARVSFNEMPDIYVINTCSVTENADKKCKSVVKSALKENPNAVITIIGCYAQLKPEEIKTIPGVDLVLGANEKFDVVNYIEKLQGEKAKEGKAHYTHIKHVKEFKPGYSIGDRTRTFLKVQDGCDYFCAFCTIPLARGRSRSTSIENTLKIAREIEDTAVNEVVLTGVNLGDFGSGTEENFYMLIQELDKLNINRFRISSIEPNLLSSEIIRFVAKSKKFVPHFHIPLQSGSDTILQSMRRRYDTALYKSRIEEIKKVAPDTCIGVDVIVGFPGETEELFLETYEFLNSLPISYLHVFSYSERNNTTAVRMQEVVPQKERTKRSRMLQILSEKKRRAFYEENLGKSATVLFESENEDGFIHGFTENYVKVRMPYQKNLENTLALVKLEEIDRGGLVRGEIISLAVEPNSQKKTMLANA
ncbi:MAG: tRNA (N(6)-L-threonylcarbamoyladenosine(37)-C(2))-methylthiotransferase MtaB [Luteibaculaceae bacterium]